MAAKDHLRRIRLPMAEKMAVGRGKKMASKPYLCKKEGKQHSQSGTPTGESRRVSTVVPQYGGTTHNDSDQ